MSPSRLPSLSGYSRESIRRLRPKVGFLSADEAAGPWRRREVEVSSGAWDTIKEGISGEVDGSL